MMAQRVLAHAYGQLGITVRFEELPNSRARSLLDSHAIDGVDYRIVDNQVSDLEKIAIPIAYEEFAVFSVNKHFKVAGYQSLQPYTIGHLAGARIFEEKLKGMQVDTAPNLESLFNKLEAGRTDIALDSRSSYCIARKLGLKNVTMLEPSLEKILAYHWLSKRHQALIPQLEAVLKKMKQDDTIKRLQDDAWKDFNARCKA